MNYKIAAFDLDGTLLDSQKKLSQENYDALRAIADKGVKVVPCTGRLYKGMPEAVRNMPFVEYAILVNGSTVVKTDRQYEGRSEGIEAYKSQEVIYRAEIDPETAADIMGFLDEYPVIYDCYALDDAFISGFMYEAVEDFVWDPIYIDMVRKLRTRVPELRNYIVSNNMPVQKIQLYTKDNELRKNLFQVIRDRFPTVVPTSSTESNIEINDTKANKGDALKALAGHLGVGIGETLACGDGLNDVPLVRTAGMGIAMLNGCPETIAAADFVTLSNDDNGVAYALRKYILLD